MSEIEPIHLGNFAPVGTLVDFTPAEVFSKTFWWMLSILVALALLALLIHQLE